MGNEPETTRHYEHFIWNSDRWEGFAPRDDDILICTAYKAGTTWTQRICSLLIFQTPELERALTTYSPWLELRAQDVETVHHAYAAQTHRRFIKTHSPLDGLPWSEAATYLFIGRDPRDIFMSMVNHIKNSMDDGGSVMSDPGMIARLGDVPVPVSVQDMLHTWLSVGGMNGEDDGWPFWSVFHHAASFWEFRHLPNIHCFHFGDMLKDLDGAMRRMSAALGIAVDEKIWPGLVEAARFETMKASADQMAPDADHGGWKDNAIFFNSGGSGSWQQVLSPEDLAFYENVVRAKLPDDLRRWLHDGGEV
jgi:aryl sulfotransferase